MQAALGSVNPQFTTLFVQLFEQRHTLCRLLSSSHKSAFTTVLGQVKINRLRSCKNNSESRKLQKSRFMFVFLCWWDDAFYGNELILLDPFLTAWYDVGSAESNELVYSEFLSTQSAEIISFFKILLWKMHSNFSVASCFPLICSFACSRKKEKFGGRKVQRWRVFF